MYKHWYLFHTSMCVCQHPFILLLFGTYVFVQASNTVRLWSSEPPISWSTSWILECVESQRLATLPKDAPKGWIQGMDMIPWYPEIFSCGNGKSRLFDRIHLQLVVFSNVILVFGFVIWRGVETVFTPEVSGHSKQMTPAVTCAVFFECNRWMFVETHHFSCNDLGSSNCWEPFNFNFDVWLVPGTNPFGWSISELRIGCALFLAPVLKFLPRAVLQGTNYHLRLLWEKDEDFACDFATWMCMLEVVQFLMQWRCQSS